MVDIRGRAIWRIIESMQATIESLTDALARETAERRRAECMAHIQSDAVQLALDLLVREPDIEGMDRLAVASLAKRLTLESRRDPIAT